MFIRFLTCFLDCLSKSQAAPVIEEVEEEQPTPEPPAIISHRLVGVNYQATTNQGDHVIEPKYLIIHYTANGSVPMTVKHFRKEGSNASAHLVIGRDGELVQMVDFNRKAWHAGESRWGNLWALNEHSIGIESVNWGPLTMRNGQLLPWTKSERDAVPMSDAGQFARNKDGKIGYWQIYPPEQLEVCFNVSRQLCREYTLLDVLGHEDISPGRKQDPGPAFPLQTLREFCFSDEPFDPKMIEK